MNRQQKEVNRQQELMKEKMKKKAEEERLSLELLQARQGFYFIYFYFISIFILLTRRKATEALYIG